MVETGGPAITEIIVRRNSERVRFTPQLGTDTALVYDYEAEFGAPSTYLVYVSTSSGTETLTQTVTLDVDLMWLIHPRSPSLSVPVSSSGGMTFLQSIGASSARSQAARHRVIGTSRDVVMSFGRRSDESYSAFSIVTTTEGEKLDMSALLYDEVPILVRMPPAWDANFREGFYAVDEWTAEPFLDRSGEWWVRWNLPLIPAVAPKVIVEPDNTYNAGLLYDSYSDSLVAQPTYFDRLVG